MIIRCLLRQLGERTDNNLRRGAPINRGKAYYFEPIQISQVPSESESLMRYKLDTIRSKV